MSQEIIVQEKMGKIFTEVEKLPKVQASVELAVANQRGDNRVFMAVFEAGVLKRIEDPDEEGGVGKPDEAQTIRERMAIWFGDKGGEEGDEGFIPRKLRNMTEETAIVVGGKRKEEIQEQCISTGEAKLAKTVIADALSNVKGIVGNETRVGIDRWWDKASDELWGLVKYYDPSNPPIDVSVAIAHRKIYTLLLRFCKEHVPISRKSGWVKETEDRWYGLLEQIEGMTR